MQRRVRQTPPGAAAREGREGAPSRMGGKGARARRESAQGPRGILEKGCGRANGGAKAIGGSAKAGGEKAGTSSSCSDRRLGPRPVRRPRAAADQRGARHRDVLPEDGHRAGPYGSAVRG